MKGGRYDGKRGGRGAWGLPRLCFCSRLLAFSLLLTFLAAARPVQAQDTTRAPADTAGADTVRALPDSLRRPPSPRDTTVRDTTEGDSLAADTSAAGVGPEALSAAEAMDFERLRPGQPVADGRQPVRQPVLGATEILARAPGAFHYNFGAVGWPHGVSFDGRAPDRTALLLDGLPFDDPLTGRPRYDLLPLPFLQPLRAGFGALGAPEAVSAAVRSYDVGRPLTELRYRTGGFQSVGALHTQRRQVSFFGPPAIAQFTGGYFGRASDAGDVLNGSALRRERRLLGRIRYRRRRWALAVTALHNRRRLGANGGVDLGEDDPLALVYAAGAPVLFSSAERRLIRTDLAATLRLRTGGGDAPLTATAYRTAQFFRYRNGALDDLTADTTTTDALEAQTNRYGLRLRQRFALPPGRLGPHTFSLAAHAWTDRLAEGNALPDSSTARTRVHLSVRDSTRLLGMPLMLGAGLHAGPVQTYPSASARLERPAAGGALRLFAEARLAGQPVAWIEEQGFGALVEPLSEGRVPGRVLRAEAGAQAQLGPVEARLALFGHQITDRLVLRATGEPAVAQASVEAGARRRVGATLSARWRAAAERGFYATASGTATRQAARPNSQAAPTVPRLYGRSRLGVRYAFFTDDLDVDAYAEGRFWSEMTSRALHSPTARLVLPPAGRRALGPAGVLDLHAEATIRTATLFFSYENALGGTQVQAGALTVPYYPLPDQRFRFGVFWPIFN